MIDFIIAAKTMTVEQIREEQKQLRALEKTQEVKRRLRVLNDAMALIKKGKR